MRIHESQASAPMLPLLSPLPEPENCIKLVLLQPMFKGAPLQLSHIYELQCENPQLLRAMLFEGDEWEQGRAVFLFAEVEDAVDFQADLRGALTFAGAYMASGEEQEIISPVIGYSHTRMEKQIEDEGFDLKNGQIHMKKITSVEYLVEPEVNPFDEQSTMVHTERKISIDGSLSDEASYQHNGKALESGQLKEQLCENNLKNNVKPILDGLLWTGVLYGGFRLFRYFTLG